MQGQSFIYTTSALPPVFGLLVEPPSGEAIWRIINQFRFQHLVCSSTTYHITYSLSLTRSYLAWSGKSHEFNWVQTASTQPLSLQCNTIRRLLHLTSAVYSFDEIALQVQCSVTCVPSKYPNWIEPLQLLHLKMLWWKWQWIYLVNILTLKPFKGNASWLLSTIMCFKWRHFFPISHSNVIWDFCKLPIDFRQWRRLCFYLSRNLLLYLN